MINKVLFFNNYPLRSTDGGPSGVLAQNILDVKSDFFFLNQRITNKPERGIFKRLKNKIIPRKTLPSFYQAKVDTTDHLRDWLHDAQKIYINVDAKNFKCIFFHDVYQLGACLPLIPKNQMIILHQISPELQSSEAIFQKEIYSDNDIKWIEEAEINAFKRANILLFANEGAQQIFKSLVEKESQIQYIPYGAKRITNTITYPLDSGKINLLYIGRRIPIKGFDIILDAFKEASLIRKDINLIIGGNGKKVEGENIYDIGFTNTPNNWINSVDYVINCNRQSYFDLAILETLSIGTPLIISTNLGHQAFKNLNSDGIIDIGEPTVENLKQAFLSNKLVKKALNSEGIRNNLELFENRFSNEIYLKNLNSFFEKLLSNQV